MGSVYRAVDENLEIPVAVKENLFLTEEYSRQFQKEANILASLHHRSLPRVRDYFTLPGVGQYLVMDFIEGEDLRQRIERVGVLPEDEVVLIGAHICNALDHLHTRPVPIIHRDIKPGNIKITPEGDVALVDFGLAKEMHTVDQATTTGARAMTPGYSPPEQYGTAHTDARSDIYSLGATLYAALTGVIPEDGLTRATNKAELTPIRDLRPRINRKLAAVIETALAVDPDERYQTAVELKQALIEAGNMAHKFQQVDTVTPPPASVEAAGEGGSSSSNGNGSPSHPMRLAARSRRRRRRPSFAVPFFATLALLAIVTFILWPRQSPAAGQSG
ncbi:MAG TPA: serine/threonine-protein kinase, partial [Anaerolineaceae bacterium]